MKLSDIAKIAGVSKATVSRALSGSTLVREDTRERIMEIARQYRYKPNTMAQAMASRRSNLIGFCLYNKSRPFFGHSFFGPILDGIAEQARVMNYHVVLACTVQERDTFEERFIEDCIDGAILVSNQPNQVVDDFRSRGIPLVLINDVLPTEHNGFIIDDNYNGARKLMHHLISERGYTSIGFVSDRLSHSSYLQRYLAYIDVHRENGLEVYSNPNLPEYSIYGGVTNFNKYMLKRHGLDEIPVAGTPIILTNPHSDVAYEEIKPLLDSGDLPRALFCTTDSIAIGVIQALKERGLRVPEDVAVCGYDDIDSAATNTPALTTIRVDRSGIGRGAMLLLQKFIDDNERPSEEVCFDNELIIREST